MGVRIQLSAAHAAALGAAAILMHGCAMIPRYTRPELPVPAAWPGAEQVIEGPAEAALDLKWQHVFPDTQLQRVIELALLNNRDLRLAALNVERARAWYGVRRVEVLPAVSATALASRQRVPADVSVTGSATTVEQYSVDLGLAAWELDLFGRLRSLRQQALHEYMSTEQARRGAQTALISEVARVYLTLAADRENLQLAQSTRQAQEEVYEMIRQQVESGVASDLDLRRSQTQVDVARADVARYTQLVELDRNALDLLAGASVPDAFLPADLASVTPPADVAPGLSSEVLLRRPDIMAAEHQLQAAHAIIGSARAVFFPRISLTTTVGTASPELSGLFGSGSQAWSFIPQAVMPIFDARTWAGVRVSEATRDIALAQYEKTVQTAFREVADALSVRATVEEQVAAQESIVDSAHKVYELSDQRYTQGIDGYLSVLDAQRSLYAAQQALTYLRVARLVNQVRLFAVLGGDL